MKKLVYFPDYIPDYIVTKTKGPTHERNTECYQKLLQNCVIFLNLV